MRIVSYAGQTIHDPIARAGGGRTFARGSAGRVVEIRIERLASMADLEALHADVVAAVHHAGDGAIICVDGRSAMPLSAGVANRWSRVMREGNRCITISAILVDPENAMFNLQLERIVRCAGSSDRRLFTDVDDLLRWVDRVATAQEHCALRGFLDQHGS